MSRKTRRNASKNAAKGVKAAAERLSYTRLGVQSLLGAHCTGIEAVFRLREILGLTRKTAIVAASGSSFTLDQGFDPRRIAQ